MTDDDHTDTAAGPAPEEAFALIGNGTRADILRVLGQEPYTGLSFSELRSRVDEGIDSGQFNYHLQQLIGTFVADTEAGYVLRAEGVGLYRAIRSGAFTGRATIEPFTFGLDCYFCGAPVEASYEDGAFEMECSGCDHTYAHTHAPPSAIEAGDPEAALDRIDRYNRHEMLACIEGVCPVCVNPLSVSFIPGEEGWSDGAERFDVFVRYACDHCGHEQFLTVGLSLLYDPELICFGREHGVDLTAVPHWELEWAMTDHHTTVRATDPWEVTLSVPLGDETLELVVDESVTVLEARRH